MHSVHGGMLLIAAVGCGCCAALMLLLSPRETVAELKLIFSGRVAGICTWRGFLGLAILASLSVVVGAVVPSVGWAVTTGFFLAVVGTLAVALIMSAVWFGQDLAGDADSAKLESKRREWESTPGFDFLSDDTD